MDHNREYCVNYILHKIKQELSFNKNLRKEFREKKRIDYTVSLTEPDGKKFIGTIIIKEEE